MALITKSTFTDKLLALVLIIILLYLGKYLFMPLSLGIFAAIFLNPFACFLESRHFPKIIAAFIPVFLLVLCAAGFLFFFKSQLANILQDMPLLKNKLNGILSSIQHWIEANSKINVDAQTSFMNRELNNMMDEPSFGLGGLLQLIILPILFVVFAFYILLFRELLVGFVLSLFASKEHEKFQEFANSVQHTINSYIKGLILEVIVLIALSAIILLILGIKFALLMAVFAGLMNLIPYAGIYAAIIINVLVTLASGTSHEALLVFAVFVSVHIADANLFMPFIVGNRIKINPLITLISVIIGELIWGIPGMFLFVPITGTLKIIFEKENEYRPFAILLGAEKEELNP